MTSNIDDQLSNLVLRVVILGVIERFDEFANVVFVDFSNPSPVYSWPPCECSFDFRPLALESLVGYTHVVALKVRVEPAWI